MARILVVEDEIDICNLLRSELEAEGHTVFQAFDGNAALDLVERHLPQLIILDWMLPGLDGLSVCRRIRQNHLIPIIMLTARNEEVDQILGLEVGADDYISKPFSIRQVQARVRAMLRRVELESQRSPGAAPSLQGISAPAAPPPLVHGSLSIHLAERSVYLDGRAIDLTPKEFDL